MDIEKLRIEMLLQKAKHILITQFGTVFEQASNNEFYHALSKALLEEIMINWTATHQTFEKKRIRTLHYLSMEYLPGKLFAKNIRTTSSIELVKAIMTKTNRNFHEILACEPDPGLGNGGLGRLASCFLDSLAAQQYPAWGYGLRYQYGIFEQGIWNGWQIERPDCWLLNQNPWELRRDNESAKISYRGKAVPAKNSHGDEIFHLEDFEEVRALPYDIPIVGYPASNFSVLSLRLWSTNESPHNFELQRYNAGHIDQASENTSLTDVLYPNDHHETGKRIRLKQEFLLVSASLQDILRRHLRIYGDLSLFSDKVRIQINDTHPALVIPELVRILTTDYDISWKNAWEITGNCCSYTNHTILREAMEEWNEGRLSHLLPRQHTIIQKFNHDFCGQVHHKYPKDVGRLQNMSIIENGQIRMANLSIIGGHKINGVSQLHSTILKNRTFRFFFELYPEKFTNITNGVTHRRWILSANPLLSEWITSKIGKGWITTFEEISKLKSYANDITSQQEFLQIKKKNKENLIEFLQKENPIRDFRGNVLSYSTTLPADALFDVHIKRIHEYKRQLMNLLHIIMIYYELKENPKAKKIKRVAILAGKAAPGYEMAKRIIFLASRLSKKINNDPDVRDKLAIVFVENYNVSKAEIIIPAADLSQQISTAGMEASGTGNIKLAMNGALTIGTEDGANIEMRQEISDPWWPFSFGSKADELIALRESNTYTPWDIYANNKQIKQALDSLNNGTFTENHYEDEALRSLYYSLLQGYHSEPADRYFILKDLAGYYETQKKVEELYLNPTKWAEVAIHNIAGMGKFSSDTAIHHYAKQIWGIQKCPIDLDIYKSVQAAYSEHDRCRILP